jgi:hypothetical protein
MNPLPPNANDLVSAYLDGQAAPDEVTIVESSPELMERVAALRSVSDLLGAPLASPPEQKEAHISAALDTFDSLLDFDNLDEPAKEVAPLLALVPPATTESSPPTEQPAAVPSLSDARQRRRPRRYNSGIIAAAAAAVLLFVALASFGFGGNDSLDVAITRNDTASSPSDAVDDTADADQNAAQIESAGIMADDAVEEEAGITLSEAQPLAAEAMDEQARMDDAPMVSDEAEEFAADSDNSDGDDAAVLGAAELFDAAPSGFLGTFPTQKSLLFELEDLSIEGLDRRIESLDPGLVPTCQHRAIPELADIEVPTLVGMAFIADQAIEVHQILGDNDTLIILILDATDCTVLPATP